MKVTELLHVLSSSTRRIFVYTDENSTHFPFNEINRYDWFYDKYDVVRVSIVNEDIAIDAKRAR